MTASTAGSAARSASPSPTWTARTSSTTRGARCWLATTRYGDDKDRVLIRQTGDPTYFLSDIAYHRDKMDRGFEHMIDIWGADHHGYVPRMKAAFTALPPHDPDKLELIIGQLVNLLESGESRRMSKRRGDIVTVDDLIDAIGVDAARFLLVGRSHDTTLELDIDLAVQQNNQNPVYYVQYAHARICSILRNLPGEGRAGGRSRPGRDVDPHERSLLRALARFPDVLVNAAEQRAPHRVHGYLGELAAEFHVFYRHCRVLSDDADVTAFRAGLCAAVRTHARRRARPARRQRAGIDVTPGPGAACAPAGPPALSGRTPRRYPGAEFVESARACRSCPARAASRRPSPV